METMKYKLINGKTGEEHLCDKVTVDGFDYYVSGNDFDFKNLKPNNLAYHRGTKELLIVQNYREDIGSWECSDNTIRDSYKLKKVIATTNPSIDLPKVVDEVKILGEDETNIRILKHKTPSQIARQYFDGFVAGHTKSQETHPFSEEDMTEFGKYCIRQFVLFQNKDQNFTQRIFLEWKEQKHKTLYYE
jgi:hypothetical protein